MVRGKERAAVIDTVNGHEDLKAIVREITDLPLIVLNTHGHCDHIWGNAYFDEAYLHPADMDLYKAHFANHPLHLPSCPVRPIEAGETVDLGGRTLEVVHIPGHTRGSIALLDRQAGFLFSGDAINGQLWMQLGESTKLADYLESLNALDPIRPAFTELHTGHNVEGVPAAYIDEMKASIRAILAANGAGDDDFQAPLHAPGYLGALHAGQTVVPFPGAASPAGAALFYLTMCRASPIIEAVRIRLAYAPVAQLDRAVAS